MARDPWTEFELVEGKYDEIAHLLSQDEELLGFVQDKIRRVSSKMIHVCANIFVGQS